MTHLAAQPQEVLAKVEMHPGQHPQFEFLGMAFNYDTIISTVVASAILLGLGFFVRAKVTSGVPNGTQLFFETVIKQVREQVESFIGIKVAPFLVPLGVALFVFILTCNWMSVLPIHWDGHPVLPPPTSDINLVFAMVAVLLVWWHVAGIRQRGGAGKHVVQTLKGHYPPFAPMWIIEEIVHPVSLGLRLFGNIFAGGIMVELLALLPAYIFWLPAAGWKLFDMGIGALQAYLFMLLTINYFAEAMEVREGAH